MGLALSPGANFIFGGMGVGKHRATFKNVGANPNISPFLKPQLIHGLCNTTSVHGLFHGLSIMQCNFSTPTVCGHISVQTLYTAVDELLSTER